MTGISVNLTPLSKMNTESFARKMTGGDHLTEDQKRQIREQQEVSALQLDFQNARKSSTYKMLVLQRR